MTRLNLNEKILRTNSSIYFKKLSFAYEASVNNEHFTKNKN